MIRILAIDDNRDNLVVLKALLDYSFPGAVLLTSESGTGGLELLEKESPDIIILDLIMPGMDGFEVLKRIRLIKDRPYLPVIILTAIGAAKDRIRALEMGADAFLTKPVDEAELIAQINAMLRLKEIDELKRNESIRLARLVEIRTRELKEEMRERQKTEQVLRESQIRLKTLNDELTVSLEQISKMNSDLMLAKEKAEESDRLKTAFLHNISHEIRTPLNAIIGFSSILARDKLTVDKKNEFANIIYKSNDQLLSIISSIIALASLESGQEKCSIKETDINQLLLDVYEQFMVSEIKKDIQFSYHADLPDEEALISTDPVKLMQIIINLVGNALKFTSKGYVKFGYTLRSDMLEFYVEDSGIGIPENMHEAVFERFRQVDNSATRHFGGTGLGLAISRGYARLIEGIITVSSMPEKGSRFILKIPYNPVTKMSKQEKHTDIPEKNIHLKGIVLIAEDEHVNYLLLSEILSGYELEIYHARNGLEAVSFCSGKITPDLILMDMKMPVMDGIEATNKIKQLKPDLPIIALTAYTSDQDRKRFFDAGCDDFIEKPFHRDRLITVLSRHLTGK